jgi:hypothetical protein
VSDPVGAVARDVLDGGHDDRLFDVDEVALARTLSLSERYVVPPFTTLDTRQGYWQERREQWLALGLESEFGREAQMTYAPMRDTYDVGERLRQGWTSVFDPVLTEATVRWYSPPGGLILDPFAGGSVRGIVSAALGRQYVGVELREEQVAANREQARRILAPARLTGAGPLPLPVWVPGDSLTVPLVDNADLVLTCPPYADLERYSDDPRDISTMRWDQFSETYRRILGRAVGALRPDGAFATVVVSNVRDRTGRYRDLVGLTVDALEDAGLALYNDAVLINRVGNGAVRAEKQFSTTRKLVRLHQSVLTFVKGDPVAATRRITATADAA